MVGSHLPYLFCVLNSPLSEWFFSKVGTTTGVGTIRWKKYTIQQLLLPQASDIQQAIFSELVTKYVMGNIPLEVFAKKVNAEIYHLVGLTETEVDYIDNYYPPLS